MSNFFYFYPSIVYNKQIVTDLLVRAKVRESWLNDPRIYYNYKYKDSDRPEHLAHKYYGEEELHWIILFTNNIFDANWDFPMDYFTFNKYIEDKYKEQGSIVNKTGLAYAQTTPDPVYRYQKTVTITTSEGISKRDYVIDEKSYRELEFTNTYSTGTPYTIYAESELNSYQLTLNAGSVLNVGDILIGNEFIPNFAKVEYIDSANGLFNITIPAKSSETNGKIFIYNSQSNYSIYEVSRKYPEITIYDREMEINESKRNVKILDKNYIRKAQEEFQLLIKQ